MAIVSPAIRHFATLIRLEPGPMRRATMQAGDGRPYFSLAADDIHAAHEKLSRNGVRTTPIWGGNGEAPAGFRARTPEGLFLSVRKEGVPVRV